jgi:MFS family permease
MDVPARQAYVSMVVSSEERSAANGITNIARSVGLVFGLGLNGYFMEKPVESP